MLPSELPDIGDRLCAFDTETSGLHFDDPVYPLPMEGNPNCRVSTVSVAWYNDEGEVEYYAFPFDQGLRDKMYQPSMLELLDDYNLPESEWDALCRWLEQRWLTAHNMKFDLHMMREGTRHWPGVELVHRVRWDSAIAEKILSPTLRIALKATAKREALTDGDEDAAQQRLLDSIKKSKLGKGVGTKTNPRYDLVSWDVMEPYAAEDALLAVLLADNQMRRFHLGEGQMRYMRRALELMAVLYKMECRGVGFDVEGCLAVSYDVHREIAKLSATLPFDPGSVASAKRYYFDEKQIAPLKVTEKTAAPQLDDEVREYLIQLEAPYIKEYDQAVRLANANSRWYEGWPARVGDDGRLRTTFRQTAVKSDRMSVERTQLHAVPKDGTLAEGIPSVRQFFHARPGFALWNLDLSQAELRAAAKLARCKLMLQMLADGADMHGITTQEIFGVIKGHPDFKVKRDVSKRLNFGGIFQIGPGRFQQTLAKEAKLHWDLHECDTAVTRWRNMYPEFTTAYYHWMKVAERRGWIYLVGGQPSYFGPRDQVSAAWNRKVQASLALFLSKWLIATERHWPGFQLLTVHDSIVLELPLCRQSELVPWGEGEDLEMVHPIAAECARWGVDGATHMFDTQMKVDVGPWRAGDPMYLEAA